MSLIESNSPRSEVMTMILRLIISFVTVGSLILVLSASGVHGADLNDKTKEKKIKKYPGALDEDELTVQEEMVPPQSLLDRASIEQKVLKSYFKKDKEEASETSKKE